MLWVIIIGNSITPMEEQKKEIIEFKTQAKIKEDRQFLEKAVWFKNFFKGLKQKHIQEWM